MAVPIILAISARGILITGLLLPPGTEVFEITGPLFFGAAYKFKESIRLIENPPRVLIIRMRHVPVMDVTGVHVLDDVHKETKRNKTALILSGVQESVLKELEKSGLKERIGSLNICASIDDALLRAESILKKGN